jgi:hypothetical protein
MATGINGDSPQAVAYALLERIAESDDWGDTRWRKSKEEILETYKECLEAVLGKYRRYGPYAG